MALRLLNFSIVVVGHSHNPSILNPDFMARTGIVPSDWGWDLDEPVFSTPPLSQVRYKNGITIVCEPSKLRITESAEPADPATSRIQEIAIGYVKALPHVPYSAVGVNFTAALEKGDPTRFLIQAFLQSGPWNTEAHHLSGLGLRLVYPLNGGHLTISLDAGEIGEGSQQNRKSVVVMDANFHHDCASEDRVTEIVGHLKRSLEFWNEYQRVVSDIMGKEE